MARRPAGRLDVKSDRAQAPDAHEGALAGVNHPASRSEVAAVILPLVRLIDLHIAAARSLSHLVEKAFVGQRRTDAPDRR